MKANPKFENRNSEFWATVKLLSQELGYSKKDAVIVPDLPLIKAVFANLKLSLDKIAIEDKLTDFGTALIEYFQYRADVLNGTVSKLLMDVDEAREEYEKLITDYQPICPIPKNKQTGEKAGIAYFTAIINILVEKAIGGNTVVYDPRQITAFTMKDFPAKSLSRRMDGSFPNEINPIAVWEIKEYYYTTTFGSRIADGVYETMLDGYELIDAKNIIERDVYHYLMIDARNTWWNMGKPYLCRIIDMIHMGLVSECIFGREAIDRIPEITKEWLQLYEKHKDQYPQSPVLTISFPPGTSAG